MTTSLYGPVLGRADVESAVLTTLRAWTVPMLAEVERQEALRPRTLPVPGGVYPIEQETGFRGGLDFETWQGEQLPLLIAVVQPTGNAERVSPNTYQQWYEVQAGAIIEDQSEHAATLLADRYGKAMMLLFSQEGGLGTRVDSTGATVPFAERTVIETMPRTEFLDPQNRRFARSVIVAHTLVELSVDGSQGLRTPPADPYADPGQWPTVTSVDLQLQSRTMLGAVDSASGVSVTDSSGHVVVSE